VLEPLGWRLWMGFLPSYTYPVFVVEALIGIALACLALRRTMSGADTAGSLHSPSAARVRERDTSVVRKPAPVRR